MMNHGRKCCELFRRLAEYQVRAAAERHGCSLRYGPELRQGIHDGHGSDLAICANFASTALVSLATLRRMTAFMVGIALDIQPSVD